MSTVLDVVIRAGAAAQQLLLLAAPHGLQGQARRNALVAMLDTSQRLGDHLEPEVELALAVSR